MKKNVIIIILSVLVLALGGYIVYDKLIAKKEDEKEKIKEEVTYKAYNSFEEVELIDGSKWVVIKDSDEKTDYVTLLSTIDYSEELSEDEYDKLYPEIFESKNKNYSKTFLNQYINNIFINSKLKFKEVDGYKIRLITLDEIRNLDNNWQYDQTNDSYYYKGTNDNIKKLSGLLTMTPTKCTQGKCTPFYYVTLNGSNELFIDHWILGLGGLNPVVNIYKSEIKVK